MFSRVGAAAYKPGLERSRALDDFFGNPHRRFKSIHIAGTNGKGSTSHMLASILTANGYKTALYTSPHLTDFRERIRIDGEMIPREKVVDFLNRWRNSDSNLKPSFFELTMMMAFDWFADEKVDIAVIEVGMGGRLDSTNIISPILTGITNISPDHMQFLGNTLAEIASEKAGIMKRGIPVVIGEAEGDVERCFEEKAAEAGAPLRKAYQNPLLTKFEADADWGWRCRSERLGDFYLPLAGEYQRMNLNTVLHLTELLPEIGIPLSKGKTVSGLAEVENSGLRGRWMRIGKTPLTICDTAHNEAGLRINIEKLQSMISKRKEKAQGATLRMVLGFVSDKDVDHIVPLMPRDAEYYITRASIPRAMESGTLSDKFRLEGFKVKFVSDDVKQTAAKAIEDASADDIIYIGGSTFIVADFLA